MDNSVPGAGAKGRRLIRWFMLKACVTEESRSQVTCVMLAASGVSTRKASP